MDGPRLDPLATPWAVIPIRGLRTAKTRLGAGMAPEDRQELVTTMLRRALMATREAASIAGTIVVTRDPAAAGIASTYGAIGLVEHAPGLNEAIVRGRSLAVARGASALLVLPADLPAISPVAVDTVIAAARGAADAARGASGVVVIVPDRHGTGTNVLLTAPPDLVAPSFGPDSHALHAAAAKRARAALVELHGPLDLDVDTPADLVLAEASLGALRD